MPEGKEEFIRKIKLLISMAAVILSMIIIANVSGVVAATYCRRAQAQSLVVQNSRITGNVINNNTHAAEKEEDSADLGNFLEKLYEKAHIIIVVPKKKKHKKRST